MIKIVIRCFYGIVFISLTLLTKAQDISFTVQEIPVEYPGTTDIWLNSLNDEGTIAGSLRFEGDFFYNYFIYKNDSVKIIPMLEGYTTLFANYDDVHINNKNSVAGYLYSSKSTPANQIFLYENGNIKGIATGEAAIYALNDSNVIAGTIQIPDPNRSHAAIFMNNTTTDIGTLGGDASKAYAINNKNWVVGQSEVNPHSKDKHAFIYKNGTMIDLGILPGHQEYSYAVAINDSGIVVGQNRGTAPGIPAFYDSFIWYNSGQLVQLPELAGTHSTYAWRINNNNIIIGACDLEDLQQVLVIWKEGTIYPIHDLIEADSGYTINRLVDINNRNEILARADFSGETRWVLLKPSVTDALIVNQTSDESDADLSDGVCDTDLDTPGNQCTLRAAIQQANHNPGKDKIVFDIPGNPNPVLQIESPLPAITEEVEIIGLNK